MVFCLLVEETGFSLIAVLRANTQGKTEDQTVYTGSGHDGLPS